MLAFVVFLAMIASCMASGISGAIIPLTLKRLGLDPAPARPFSALPTDVVSMGMLLGLATILIRWKRGQDPFPVKGSGHGEEKKSGSDPISAFIDHFFVMPPSVAFSPVKPEASETRHDELGDVLVAADAADGVARGLSGAPPGARSSRGSRSSRTSGPRLSASAWVSPMGRLDAAEASCSAPIAAHASRRC